MTTKPTTGTDAADNGEQTGTVSEPETKNEEQDPGTGEGSEDDDSNVTPEEDDGKKLDFWKRQARENEKELKKLRKLEEDRRKAELSETERLKEEREELSKELSDLRRKAIAAEYGLDTDLAERLRGVTEEELRSDAESLAKLVKPPKPKPTEVGIGVPGKDDAPTDPVELARSWTRGR